MTAIPQHFYNEAWISGASSWPDDSNDFPIWAPMSEVKALRVAPLLDGGYVLEARIDGSWCEMSTPDPDFASVNQKLLEIVKVLQTAPIPGGLSPGDELEWGEEGSGRSDFIEPDGFEWTRPGTEDRVITIPDGAGLPEAGLIEGAEFEVYQP